MCGNWEWHNASVYTLTRGALLKSDDWDEWQQSEFAQLDQYDEQGMFGTPVNATGDLSVFNLVWSYVVKELDKRKKARCTCDGSSRGGQVRVLDHTYANCVDQTSSRLFYAIAAMENLMVYGADVTNAFGEAEEPKQGFFPVTQILPYLEGPTKLQCHLGGPSSSSHRTQQEI